MLEIPLAANEIKKTNRRTVPAVNPTTHSQASEKSQWNRIEHPKSMEKHRSPGPRNQSPSGGRVISWKMRANERSGPNRRTGAAKQAPRSRMCARSGWPFLKYHLNRTTLAVSDSWMCEEQCPTNGFTFGRLENCWTIPKDGHFSTIHFTLTVSRNIFRVFCKRCTKFSIDDLA